MTESSRPSSRVPVLNRGAASVWLQTDGGKTEKADESLELLVLYWNLESPDRPNPKPTIIEAISKV
jgi:hypothetical protein